VGKNSKIQWTDSTVNPTKGCGGCELWGLNVSVCYAGRLTKRFGKSNKGLAKDFDVVELAPGRMAEAARWSDLSGTSRLDKPWLGAGRRKVFVGDMADILSKEVPFDYLQKELIDVATSELGRRHDWQLLTKRPQRLKLFANWLSKRRIAWPTNVWVGTSVTRQSTTKRIAALLKVGDRNITRFVSVEPQLERIDLSAFLPGLDWIIQGGESGSPARAFDLSWADDLRGQCKRFRVAYFLKQLGSRVIEDGERAYFEDRSGGNWPEWPPRLQVRQMPS